MLYFSEVMSVLRTSPNLCGCHLDRFVCVTEVYLSVSLLIRGRGTTHSNIQSLIGPLPEYYTLQSCIRYQHSRLMSACLSNTLVKEAYNDTECQLEHLQKLYLERAYTKFVGTKADILNGRGTASPVSGWILEFTTEYQSLFLISLRLICPPDFHISQRGTATYIA